MFTTVEYVIPCQHVMKKIEKGFYSEDLQIFLASKTLLSQIATLAKVSCGNVYRLEYLRDTNEQRITLAFFDAEDLPDEYPGAPLSVANSSRAASNC